MTDAEGGATYDIDALAHGNETRFINDYHGIADTPNVGFVAYHAQQTGELAVGVLSRRVLKRGEELLVDYGRKFWSTAADAGADAGADACAASRPPPAPSPPPGELPEPAAPP